MRIERLVEDNTRTQGAARRAWYRRHAPQHLAAVARLAERALAARAPDAPTSVVVLGAGACTEIPLERLARASERVVLVDLDAPGMERARQEVPASLRERVRVLVSDISGGVSDALGALLRAEPWHDLAHLSTQAVLATAASALERVPVPDPPPLSGLGAGGWGVVISSFVLTQLFSLPLLDVRDQLALVTSEGAAPDADPRFHAAAQTLRRRIALAHAHLLATLVAPGGVALFMSDTTGHLLPPSAGPHASDPRESLAVLPPDVLAIPHDFAPRLHLIGEPQRWEWLVSAPSPAQHGRAYDAVGALFRPA
jgi:hypothetical protein